MKVIAAMDSYKGCCSALAAGEAVLRGVLRAFDSFTVVLDSDGKQQLIYKHAISTIAPARPLNLGEAAQADT